MKKFINNIFIIIVILTMSFSSFSSAIAINDVSADLEDYQGETDSNLELLDDINEDEFKDTEIISDDTNVGSTEIICPDEYPGDETSKISTSQVEEDFNDTIDVLQGKKDDDLLGNDDFLDAYRLLCEYIQDLDISAGISLETFIEEYDINKYKTVDDYCKSYYDILSPDNDVSPHVSVDDSEIRWQYNAGTTLYEEPKYTKYNLLEVLKPGDIIFEAYGGYGITGHTAIVEGIYYSSNYNQFYIRVIEAIMKPGAGVCRGVFDDVRYDAKGAKILRVSTSDDKKKEAINFCISQIGKDYFLDFAHDEGRNQPTWYCSELVWAAYKEQNIDLEHVVTENGEGGELGITPRDLFASAMDEDFKTLKVIYDEDFAESKRIIFNTGSPLELYAEVNGPTKATISWDPVTGTNKYYLYKTDKLETTDPNFSYYTILSTDTTTFNDKALKENSTYFYRASGSRKGGKGKLLAIKSGFTSPIITYSKCLNSSTTFIQWSPVYGADGYYIYRSTDGKTYDELATVNIGQTYMDSTVQPGNIYYYRVAAYNSVKTTARSGSVKLHPVYVEKPSLFSGTSTKKDDVTTNTIKWTNVPGAEYYNVYRSNSQTGNYTFLENAGDNTYYKDNDVVSGTVYYYKVCACIGGTSGEQSNYKSIRAR